jgi:hypothetical protein
MREYVLYMWIGVWLILVPFFGIPGSWKNGLIILTGFGVALHSFIGYRRTRVAEESDEEVADSESASETTTESTA